MPTPLPSQSRARGRRGAWRASKRQQCEAQRHARCKQHNIHEGSLGDASPWLPTTDLRLPESAVPSRANSARHSSSSSSSNSRAPVFRQQQTQQYVTTSDLAVTPAPPAAGHTDTGRFQSPPTERNRRGQTDSSTTSPTAKPKRADRAQPGGLRRAQPRVKDGSTADL